VLEVSDSENATATATFTVYVRPVIPPSIPTITATANGTGTSDQACPERPLTLTAHAANATSYQWYDDGSAIYGETNVTYIATGRGNFTVSASNACYTSAQSFFVYNVSNPTPHKAFLTASGSTNLCTGGSVTLSSDSATGIQWYRDGVAISGGTHQSYVATQAGSYTAILNSMGCHAQESDAIVVTLNATPPTPTISGPETTYYCAESPITLTSSSTSGNQWYINGDGIGGANQQTYTVETGGEYTVVVTTDGCSSAASSSFHVDGNVTPHRPFITAAGSTDICEGGSVMLMSDAATGIQWYLDGVAISGANSQSYVATQAGSYTATLNNLGCIGPISDPPVIVTVSPVPPTPTISATPNGTGTSDQACPEQPLTLTASSSGAVSFQWYSDDAPIGGEISSTLVVTARGNYSATATFGGACSSPRSDAYVVQNPTPHKAFLSTNGATTFCAGGSVTIFSDSATGIQWYRDGVPIANGTSYVATQSGSYTVILNALGCHSQESDPIVVTVNAYPDTPTISATQNGTGTSDQACPEQPLTLTATSANATSFQWYDDDAPLYGETNATYIATGRGNFSVTATSNDCTSARSATYAVQNPTPHKAFLTANGSTTFCTGGSVTIFSDSATGIQWYRDGVAISGGTHQSYVATQSGSYTAILNNLGCHAQESDPIVVTVNAYPSTPTISGPAVTYFCAGGSITLTSSSTSGNQWYINGELLGGSTDQTYAASVGGEYTVVITTNGCSSATSSAFHIDGNVTPHKPFITTSGATTFCSGGNVTLMSDAATGIQWYRDGVAISGAGSQSYVATQSGTYTATLNALGCISPTSDAVVVTVNANPSATITAPANVVSGSTGNSASVASAGSGATYSWTISGGTITSGSGTNAITFTAASTGTLTLSVTVTTSAGCSATQSASVNVVDPVTVTNVTPSTGSSSGGTSITIKGTGFASGATVTLGGTAATGVVVVSSTKITATTPAHSSGAVDVVVTNSNSASGTLSGGFTYKKK